MNTTDKTDYLNLLVDVKIKFLEKRANQNDKDYSASIYLCYIVQDVAYLYSEYALAAIEFFIRQSCTKGRVVIGIKKPKKVIQNMPYTTYVKACNRKRLRILNAEIKRIRKELEEV
jgi:hypothetical protein